MSQEDRAVELESDYAGALQEIAGLEARVREWRARVAELEAGLRYCEARLTQAVHDSGSPDFDHSLTERYVGEALGRARAVLGTGQHQEEKP